MGNTAAADSVSLDICAQFPATPASWSAGHAIAEHAMNAFLADTLFVRAYPPLDTLANQFPRFWPRTLDIHRRILQRQLNRGLSDSALALARRMASLYGRDELHGSQVHALQGLVALGKRDRKEAVDILNRCVASHSSSEGVWQAWMLLASVYEYDLGFRDALTIYRKVSRECPPGNVLRWMARLRMAELAAKAGHEESPESILRDVTDGDHPFILPRAIALFYLGQLGETQLTDIWHHYHPGDWYFLYYLARKALMEGERVVAEIYLQQLVAFSQPGTWRYLSVYQMLSNLDRY